MKFTLTIEGNSKKELLDILNKQEISEVSIQEPERQKIRAHKKFTQYELDAIVDFYKRGHKVKAIAKSLQRTKPSIAIQLSKMFKAGLLK